MKIAFSPPDISELEINEVSNTLRSGWITTGLKTKLFEKRIAEYCSAKRAVCLNSATACLEIALRILGIGAGDEVITSAYTYTASASVIAHVGAKIILIDTQVNNYEMDYEALARAINKKTKAIICVDIAGVPCDYEKIYKVIENSTSKFIPKNDIQKAYGRVILIDDAAHSFGATYKNKIIGSIADFTSFSFHAVKNLTTSEGGAIVWKEHSELNSEAIYKEFMLYSLHGQNKDAFSKMLASNWEYDILTLGYKCNMTDIMSSIGLVQLDRYPKILERRMQIINKYNEKLSDLPLQILQHSTDKYSSSGHLYLTRLLNCDETLRNKVICDLADLSIATNVHYKPLPMFTAYKNYGFNIGNFPNAYNLYKNEITLPLHTLLSDSEVDYVADNYKKIVGAI